MVDPLYPKPSRQKDCIAAVLIHGTALLEFQTAGAFRTGVCPDSLYSVKKSTVKLPIIPGRPMRLVVYDRFGNRVK